MEISRLSELRPRNVWDIIDDSFDLYRERFVPLCAVSAVVGAPAALASLAFQAGPLARFFKAAASTGSSNAEIGSLFAEFFLGIALALPLLMAAQILQHGAVAVVVDDYLHGRHDISLKRTYKRLFEQAGTVLATALLFGILFVISFCAIFPIGTIYVLVIYALVGQVLVVERRGVWDTFRRSRLLSIAQWGRIFGLILVTFTLSALISGGIAAVVSVAFALTPTIKGMDSATVVYQQQMLSSAIESVAQLLIAPFSGIALSLMYYDIRVRQEGFDMVAQAEDMGVTLAPDPFGDLPSAQAALRDRKTRERTQHNAQGAGRT